MRTKNFGGVIFAADSRWARDVRRWLTDHTGLWKPISADGIEMFDAAAVPIIRYRYRGNKIPNPRVQAA